MSVLRLALCVVGVYSMFLLWAIAQERLSVPFQSLDGSSTHKFHSALFLGTCQSALCSLSALFYLLFTRDSSDSLLKCLGIVHEHPSKLSSNGNANGNPISSKPPFDSSILFRYFQCSIFITSAAPFGFAALSYISYPAMVLGKSCKLIPVMLMNVLLYRRKFAPHKYLVVAMVTLGITIFMGFGEGSTKKKKGDTGELSPYANLIGITYLLINLALDGATNSTQDEIFSAYKVTGQQMMFWINLFCTALSLTLAILPLPHIPVFKPSTSGSSEFMTALTFLKEHEGVAREICMFALTGALGQLFIFETLQHFGSLTLVMITLTRKLFTMLLSVAVFNHKLTLGQWLGAAVVFAGISVEAFVKRRARPCSPHLSLTSSTDIHTKRVIQEKEKATIKSL